jgi:hypothetical protein
MKQIPSRLRVERQSKPRGAGQPARRVNVNGRQRPGGASGKSAVEIALDRIAERQNTFFDDTSRSLGDIRDRLDKTDARQDQFRQDVERELTHLNNRVERFHETNQRDIAELTVSLAEHENATAQHAAKGAAQGAVAGVAQQVVAASVPSAGEIVKAASKSWWVRTLAVATGFSSLVLAGKNIPAFLNWLEKLAAGVVKLWQALKGL